MHLISITATRNPSWVRLIFSSRPPLLFPIDNLSSSSLKKGVNISPKKLLELKKTTLVQKLIDYSYKMLAQRPHSIQKLTQKLNRKLYEYENKMNLDTKLDLFPIIKNLEDQSYLDDDRFALYWIEREIRRDKKSNQIIIRGLLAEGISRHLIQKHIHLLSQKREMDLLKKILDKKMSKKSPDKIITSLLYSGFTYRSIKQAIDQKAKKQ